MRPILTCTLALAALIGAAQARDAGAQQMRVLQGGEHFAVEWSGPQRDNLVGGAIGRMTGGGQDRGVAYEPGSVSGQASYAMMSGGGEDMTFTRAMPDVPATMLARRAPAAMPEVAEAPAPRRR